MAEYLRLLNLRKRKGIVLEPKRTMKPHHSYEYADYITLLGNDFTLSTFDHIKKPVFKIPISTNVVFPWPEDKDYENCRSHFLYFGGWGFVHKGLDLVLDAFAQMPDHHLYVCGPIHAESDFERAFHKELYETPNIHTIGWVDVNSSKFLEILTKCVGFVFPSCSEAMSGGVVQCIHAGLIPIISYESGVDIFDFGVILKDCSVDNIKSAILSVSSFPAEKLKSMSRKAWQYARRNHTRERFAQEYSNAINQIMAKHFSQKCASRNELEEENVRNASYKSNVTTYWDN
jgi:glycosyltransferase involved in cell wall biosynthesis